MFASSTPQDTKSALWRYLKSYRELTERCATDLAVINAIQLRRIDALMRGVFENSFDAIAIFNQDGLIEAANDGLYKMFGITADELSHWRFFDLFPDVADTIRLWQPGAVPRGCFEASGRRADGSTLPVEIAIAPVKLAEDSGIIAIIRDITERKRQQRRLEHQALHDALTELPNRILFNDRLESAIAMSRRTGAILGVVLLDLDRFKDVNDTLGHKLGDQLLRDVSRRLQQAVRNCDTVARLGGDEFAIILPSVGSESNACDLTMRLSGAILKPFALGGLFVEVGVSAGIALFPLHAEHKEKLLQYADVAMYAAKREHSRVALYHPSIDHHSIKKLTLASALRNAIERREIFMKYQPKVDLMTGQIVGFEALARWTHAEHGPIPPNHFVTETEQTGLVIPLTLLTLDLSLREVARWQECLPDVSVAVNLSARSLQDVTLPEMLERALKKQRVRPDWVTLEITESALMANPERALRVAEEIARLGIRLAIDDFGTGYSSLAYLSRLPVSELKVDKSFVLRMLDYERDARIVQSTIDLAHNLGLKVVAEGVETAHVLVRLRDLGCDAAQGYLIGAPGLSPASSELRPALGQPFVCASNSLPESATPRRRPVAT